jgi:hypothetical protein
MAKKPAKTPLNLNVLKTTAKYLRDDAKKFGKTLDDLGDAILKNFLLGQPEDKRLLFYAKLPNKRIGRKIS